MKSYKFRLFKKKKKFIIYFLMDNQFFRVFNPDFSYIKDTDLEKVKQKLIRRIVKEEDFYNKYPYFDLEFYRNSYKDLVVLDNYQLMRHYHFHGKKEGRICNKSQLSHTKILFNDLNPKLLKFLSFEDKTKVEILHRAPNIFHMDDLKKELLPFSKFNLIFYKNYYNINNKSIKRFINNSDEICNLEDFSRKYPDYDKHLFYKLNYYQIDDFLKSKNWEINDLNLCLTFKKFKDNNINFVETSTNYIIKHKLKKKIFETFQPHLKNLNNNDYIKLYINRSNNEYIFIEEDFYLKYPNFNLKFFQIFNNYQNKIECMSIYHINYSNNRLIGNLNDFYYNYSEYKGDDQDLEKLVEYHKKKIGETDLTFKELKELYPKFNYKFYTSVYVDLRNHNEFDALLHWHQHGKLESRICNYNIPKNVKNIFEISMRDFYKYPFLFHKFLLGINDYNKKIKYKVCKNIVNNNFGKCHIHCHNLNDFNKIFGNYIDNIIEYFSVVLTFSEGNWEELDKYNITILEIENIGMDIGAKIVTLKYFYDNNIDYSNILFLHSKKNETKRNEYFYPFIKSKKQINMIYSILGVYDIIAPDLVMDGDWDRGEGYTLNKKYYDEITNLLNIDNLTQKNIEGNCLVVSKKILNKIFPIKYLTLFYNLLNNDKTFDYNWVNTYYSIGSDSIYEVYDLYKKNQWLPNHLVKNSKPLLCDYEEILSGKSLLHGFLKDCAIEHVFERLWYNTCENLNGKIKIIKKNEIFDDVKMSYSFDTNLFREINNNFEYTNNIFDIEILKLNALKNNQIYSLKQILKMIPIDFDIEKYYIDNNLFSLNKYQIINHYIKNYGKEENSWITLQKNFNPIKTFVFIFPQFHEIPENNKFWCNGFTEWNNVVKTYSLNKKHLPMHPHPDIGFYDILEDKTFKRWDSYAENYNFEGYIFFHYWFKEGIIMNKPLDNIINKKNLNKPWFLTWVNENWTKRWDGGNNDILLEIKIDLEQCKKHSKVLVNYFKHKNYYKIDGKPVLSIYRTEEINKEYIDTLVNLVKEEGFDGIFFIKMLNMKWDKINVVNTENYWSGEIEYPPNYKGIQENSYLSEFNEIKNKSQYLNFMDYKNFTNNLIKSKGDKEVFFKGIFPCWDNFPRHSSLTSNSNIFLGSNSFVFYLTLLKQFREITLNKSGYHCINSLNEWGEQCVLEPSVENDYSYLDAYRLAKKTDLSKINFSLLDKLLNFNGYQNLLHKLYLTERKPKENINYNIVKRYKIINKNLCIIHCFNIDNFYYFFGDYIKNLEEHFSIIVTYSLGNIIPEIDAIILKVRNRGCNQGGYVVAMDYIYKNYINFKTILFLHSKTNDLRRQEYFTPLIGNKNSIIYNLEKMKYYSAIFPLMIKDNLDSKYKSNRYYFYEYLDLMNIKDKKENIFAEGNCMFLDKEVIDFIFKNKTELYYSIFNELDDFDLSWVRHRYSKYDKTPQELYNDFINKESYFDINDCKNVGNNFKNKANDLPDGMVEHIFERIYINVLNDLELKWFSY